MLRLTLLSHGRVDGSHMSLFATVMKQRELFPHQVLSTFAPFYKGAEPFEVSDSYFEKVMQFKEFVESHGGVLIIDLSNCDKYSDADLVRIMF